VAALDGARKATELATAEEDFRKSIAVTGRRATGTTGHWTDTTVRKLTGFCPVAQQEAQRSGFGLPIPRSIN
jgi:hypothetical protein